VTPCPISQNEFDVVYYNLADLVRPSATPYRVQCGDSICIVGLFHWHSGSGRNTPIVHSGNIALLPDPMEKIPIKDRIAGQLQKVEAYLVEAQTFEGLSGAGFSARDGCDAGTLGIRVGTLDDKVEAIRKKLAVENDEEALPHWNVEPWPEEVDGDALLDSIRRVIRRYIVW